LDSDTARVPEGRDKERNTITKQEIQSASNEARIKEGECMAEVKRQRERHKGTTRRNR
jgi:hypothetical protein